MLQTPMTDPELKFEPVIVEIAKLELNDGDVLAVKVHRKLNTEDIKQIADALNSALPKGVKAVIMPSESEIEVMRTQPK